MRTKMIAVGAFAAMLGAGVPAHAAKNGMACGGANLEKAETAVEAMADGDAKYGAEKEVALAQDALLSGKMGACAVHLAKAAHAGMGK